MTSINIAAILGVFAIMLPLLSAKGERLVSAMATRLTNLSTLAAMLASLTLRSATGHPPQFWQLVASLQKALAARTAFVGSTVFVTLVKVQIVLTILICQGTSTDFMSLALICMITASALAIFIVAGLYEITTDVLATCHGFGVAIFQTLRSYQEMIPDWIAPVPLPPPRRS